MFNIDSQRDALIAQHLAWVAREGLEVFEGSRASIANATEDRRYMQGIGVIPQSESKRKTPRRAPRLTDSSVTSDVVVTTADGSRYTIKRGKRSRNHVNGRTINAHLLKDVTERRAKVSAANLAAIGDSNH